MREPEQQTKIAIIQHRINLWTNTKYEAEVQARVAKVIGNQTLLKEATTKAEEAIRALDELQKLADELAEVEG